MSEQGKKILLADDEQDVLILLNYHLERAGYTVLQADNGRAALEIAEREQPTIVILDWLMPEINGVEVCKILRGKYPEMYVLLLTALHTEDKRVLGLEAGADDYVTKPFSGREIVLRVKNILRRGQSLAFAGSSNFAMGQGNSATTATLSPDSPLATATLPISSVQLDPERRQVWKNGSEIDLTKLEFDLLKFLSDNPSLVFSRNRLLEQVWNYDYFGDERVVDVHMARLRKKLEDDPARPRYIHTIRGVGYKFIP